MPGPQRKTDDALRRRRTPTPGFRQLPPEGRPGPAPAYPLPGGGSIEIVKWEELWQLPQAVEWERIGCYDTVALYVKVWHELQEDFDPKLLTELRQLDNKIGLSPRALKELGWEIANPDKEEPEVKRPGPERPRVYVPDSRHPEAG